MTSTHRVWKLGPDIDTDVLAPGHAMKHGLEKIAQHCLESVRPEFAAQVRPGDVVVAGPNFGIGSSREQAAAVLVKLGVAAVIAPSYSGLYFRNAFNVGLLLLTCAEADILREGESVVLDAQARWVQSADGRRLACDPIPDFLLDMARSGGLMNQLRARFGKEPV
jgi:3-isopropylmalate/(R)-2-methylmalate dehydratase small subunit